MGAHYSAMKAYADTVPEPAAQGFAAAGATQDKVCRIYVDKLSQVSGLLMDAAGFPRLAIEMPVEWVLRPLPDHDFLSRHHAPFRSAA